MALTITNREMTSPDTKHIATPVTSDPYGSWLVTWLPGRRLTRNQAITAMTIAEVVGRVPVENFKAAVEHFDPWWPHLDGWAAELGLSSGVEAVGKAAEFPEIPGSMGCGQVADDDEESLIFADEGDNT